MNKPYNTIPSIPPTVTQNLQGSFRRAIDNLAGQPFSEKIKEAKEIGAKASTVHKTIHDDFDWNKPVDFSQVQSEPAKDQTEIKSTLDQLSKQINTITERINGIDSSVAAAVKELKNAPREPFIIDIPLPSGIGSLEQLLDEVESALNKNLVKNINENISDLSQNSLGNDLTYTERGLHMKKNGWFNEIDGTRKHYVDGKLHREDGPAEIRANGTELFYRDGKLHRDGGNPAMMGAGGTRKYAVDGKYHRLGGQPAVTWSKGEYRNEWWTNGQITHVEMKNGTREWYASGCTDRDRVVLHRVDGPARVHPNGKEEFYLNGRLFKNRTEWEHILNELNRTEILQLDKGLIDEDPIDSTVETTRQNNKEEKKMNKPSFTETLKANAITAGYRVAGTQATTIVKNAVIAIMKNKGADGGAIQGISAFLNTEFGEAFIAFALGSGLHYVPHFNEDPRVQRLAEELRVNGMATVGNAVIGEAMSHVLPALTQVLQNLPAIDNKEATTSSVRVEENKLVDALNAEDDTNMEEEVSVKKTAKV